MTINVSIKNEDSRANAIIEVISTDTYRPYDREGNVMFSTVRTQSEAVLKGGESKTVYVTSTMKLEVIERQNG